MSYLGVKGQRTHFGVKTMVAFVKLVSCILNLASAYEPLGVASTLPLVV